MAANTIDAAMRTFTRFLREFVSAPIRGGKTDGYKPSLV
jgi:hypothetical protein